MAKNYFYKITNWRLKFAKYPKCQHCSLHYLKKTILRSNGLAQSCSKVFLKDTLWKIVIAWTKYSSTGETTTNQKLDCSITCDV